MVGFLDGLNPCKLSPLIMHGLDLGFICAYDKKIKIIIIRTLNVLINFVDKNELKNKNKNENI